jgi:drug/metabolite transporter (DMT)-like permease
MTGLVVCHIIAAPRKLERNAMARKMNFQILGLFIFIVLSWGLAWPINKIGLDYLSPLWYTSIRLVIGTLTMMAFVLAVNKFALPRRQDLPLILIIGLLQISVYIFLANLGLAYIPAGRASLLAYTTPLWVMPIAIIFFGEKPGHMKWLGFLFGITGLFFLLSPWELDWSDKNVLFGTAMLLLASLSWAISMLCARYMHWSKSPLELIPWQLLVGTIPILLFACYKEPSVIISWNPTLLLSLIYTGALVTGISYWSGVVINKELPTIIVSLGFLLVPVLSLTTSALFMHEAISLTTACSIGLILAGLVCVVV